MNKFNPAWLFHKTNPAKIFTDQASYDLALAKGWVDSPAKIEGGKDAQEKALPPPHTIDNQSPGSAHQTPPAAPQQPAPVSTDTTVGSAPTTNFDGNFTKPNYKAMLVPQLKEALIAKGTVDAAIVVKMTKAQLIEALEK